MKGKRAVAEAATPIDDLLTTAARIRDREVSPVEVVEAALRRAEALSPVFNAYITILADAALAEARAAEDEIAAGTYRGPLHGIPLSIKDIYWTKGTRTTAGSRVLTAFVPDEDATVVAHLREAGAVILAKANTYQFASSPPHEDFGPTRNPWNPTRTTRGSSSGSAAAVAAGIDFGSFGSDTGGSIRVPAAFTGIAGFKPSFGLVSRHRMQAVSWTLDHAGPMARSVADLEALLWAVAGPDDHDPATLDPTLKRGATRAACEGLAGITIGILTDFLDDPVEPEVAAAVRQATSVFAEAGAELREVALPGFLEEAMVAHRAIMWPEAAHVHRAWFDQRPQDYTAFSREKLADARQIPAVAYIEALETRRRLQQRMAEIQRDLDVLLLPAAPMVATPLESTDSAEDRGAQLDDLGRWNAPFNLTGQPALTVPCGCSRAGLPIGLQVLGRRGADGLVLDAGLVFQDQTPWHTMRPPLGAGATAQNATAG